MNMKSKKGTKDKANKIIFYYKKLLTKSTNSDKIK